MLPERNPKGEARRKTHSDKSIRPEYMRKNTMFMREGFSYMSLIINCMTRRLPKAGYRAAIFLTLPIRQAERGMSGTVRQ